MEKKWNDEKKKKMNEKNCKIEYRQVMCKTIRDYETKFGEIWIRNEAALGFFQIASAQEQQEQQQEQDE